MIHQRIRLLAAFSTAILILALSVTGETAKREASQLTLLERISARQAEITRQRRTVDAQGNGLGPVRISGAVTPELLLPIELFRHLTLIAFDSNSDARDHVRRGMSARATAAGITMPYDFWQRLESTASAYLESNRLAQTLSTRINPVSSDRPKSLESGDSDRARSIDSADPDYATLLQELRQLKSSQCELRETALTRAYTEFGSQWFGRFLYGAVAPIVHLVITGEEPTDPAALLRDVQGGCQ